MEFNWALKGLKMNTKTENPNTWSVIRILNYKSFHPGEICKQIVDIYGEGAVYKGNVRKLCWLFKEGMTTHDCTLLHVHAHYLNRSNGKFWSIFHTVPTLMKWRSLVSPPQETFRQPESEKWPRDKRCCAWLDERLNSKLFSI